MSRASGSKATHKHKTQVVHLLMCSKHFWQDFRVCRRRVPPAFTSRELEVGPLLVAPSLVRGLQPNGRRDNVDGPVAHDQPSVLRFQEHDDTATFGPHAAVGLSARGPTMA